MSEQSTWKEIDNYIPENIFKTSKDTKNQRAGIFKILRILVCTLAAVLLIEGVAYFIVIPNTTASSVSFSGLKTLDANKLGLGLSNVCGTNWLKFNTSSAASHLLSYSAVESVSVQKHFPNKIIVDIKERTPVALTLANINDRTVPALVDKQGVVFSTASTEISDSLPLISGFESDTFFEGMRINSKYYPLLQQISEIQKTNAQYFQTISEILITPKEHDNYELVIFPIHTKTRVLVDRNFSEDALQYMLVALDVLNSVNPNVSELDLRYGTVSYKTGL